MTFIVWVFGIVTAVTVAASLAMVGLDRWANRTRHSEDAGPAAEPVKHTEEERAALWAELAPEPKLTRRERAVARALHRRSLIVARQISDDMAALDSAERDLYGGLDALWRDVCTQLGADDIDVEWSLLAAGELVDA